MQWHCRVQVHGNETATKLKPVRYLKNSEEWYSNWELSFVFAHLHSSGGGARGFALILSQINGVPATFVVNYGFRLRDVAKIPKTRSSYKYRAILNYPITAQNLF